MIFLWIFVIFFMHKKCEWLCDLLARSTTSQRQRHSLSEQAGCSVAVWRSTSDGVSLTLPSSRAEQARRHITVSMTASCEQEAQQNGRRCKPSDRHGNQVSLLNFHVIWTNRLLIIFSTYPKSNKYFTIFAKNRIQKTSKIYRWHGDSPSNFYIAVLTRFSCRFQTRRRCSYIQTHALARNHCGFSGCFSAKFSTTKTWKKWTRRTHARGLHFSSLCCEELATGKNARVACCDFEILEGGDISLRDRPDIM